MKIIYTKSTGKIFSLLYDNQDYKRYYRDLPFVEELHSMDLPEDFIGNIHHFKINNGNIEEYSNIEKKEIDKYGKILSDEERELEVSKPSNVELQQRIVELENVIDILLGGVEDGI